MILKVTDNQYGWLS